MAVAIGDASPGRLTPSALMRRPWSITRCRRPLRYSLCRSACLLAPFGEVW